MTKGRPGQPHTKAKALTIERWFNASPERLWAFWTEPEKFAKWFNPAPGMELVIHEYQARPGGRVRFDMPQPDGNRNPQEGVFHSLDPYREIVTGAPDRSFLIKVHFEPVGARTRMSLTVTGIPPQVQGDAAKGWNSGFDKLAHALGRNETTFTFPSDRELLMTRIFDAPRERVFKVFSDPSLIPQWWGPRRLPTTVDKMDVRPGGVWRFVSHGPGGEEYAFHGEYREVVPPERVVSTFEFEGMPGRVILETVAFEDLGRRTRMTVRSLFQTVEDRDGMFKAGMEAGARESHDRFDELLARMAELSITRIFDAPRELVWKAWTDPERVKRWWGPKGFTTPFCTIDLRVGGVFLYCMRSPEGKDYWGTGIYREIVPPERIVSTDSFADEKGNVVPATRYGMSPDFPLEMLVTVTFEALGGKTKLTLHHLGIPSGPDREGAGQGWNESFDKLAAHLDRRIGDAR